mmetsp:Transcript_22551/g.46856  ORF Transcript_22551/g.46856 Transcript_22551/m.46856 type:complete len:287 (+) Transcript_22551:126-986(+)
MSTQVASSSSDIAGVTIVPGETLTAYEEARAEKIERNNALLYSLGLISEFEMKVSNLRARGVEVIEHDDDEEEEEEGSGSEYEGSDNEDEEDEESVGDDENGAVNGSTTTTTHTLSKKRQISLGTTKKKKQKRKRRKKKGDETSVPREGARKSLRIRGLTPDGGELTLPVTREEIIAEREKRVVECREARLKAANEVAKAGHSKAAMENPTASYEHCAMRVRTMTEKALLNRIKTIERACGKHCVVKMAIFKSCLQDKGLWDLAEKAAQSLERLKSAAADPEPDKI